jgi:hypothetical protein
MKWHFWTNTTGVLKPNRTLNRILDSTLRFFWLSTGIAGVILITIRDGSFLFLWGLRPTFPVHTARLRPPR